MKGRSVRLGSDDDERERQIFERYGINQDTFSDNYRALLRLLHENLHKETPVPPAKYEKPDCKHLSEPQPSIFHCVYQRANAPPHIKAVHLIDCAACMKLRNPVTNETPSTTLSPPREETAAIQTQRIQFADDEHLTPFEGYEKVAFYVRSDNGKFCPFEHDKRAQVVYKYNCLNCEKHHNKKYLACLTLRSTIQSVTQHPKVTTT